MMNHTEVVQRFCELVNEGLSQGKDTSASTYEQLIVTVGGTEQQSLLDQLYENYSLAREPETFSNVRIVKPDERFKQCYELLQRTFDEAELDPKKVFSDSLESLQQGQDASPLVMIGRFWRVCGSQQYDTSGQLSRFGFDPLTITESIMGVIDGNYMSMLASSRPKESMGAIGHLATRRFFRRRGGHGTILLQAFEQEVEALATGRGEKLQLIALEANQDSWPFWARKGYRWPAGSRYFQPPLEFDPVTGERFHDEVPELLMVKIWNDPSATHIDAKLLIDAVQTMYENWCLTSIAADAFTEEAVQRARDYVFGKVFTEFVASLPPAGKPIPLQEPSGTEM